MQIKPCKHCGVVPVVSDVGGNNPFYEIYCNCENGMVVGSKIKAEAITHWNIFNDRSDDIGRKTDVR